MTKKKLMFSIKQIEDLDKYLKILNIELVVVLFPWAYELFDQSAASIYEEFTSKKLLELNIKTFSCYKSFQKENVLDQLELIGKSFQFADIHYNNFGNQIFSSCINKNLNSN